MLRNSTGGRPNESEPSSHYDTGPLSQRDTLWHLDGKDYSNKILAICCVLSSSQVYTTDSVALAGAESSCRERKGELKQIVWVFLASYAALPLKAPFCIGMRDTRRNARLYIDTCLPFLHFNGQLRCTAIAH